MFIKMKAKFPVCDDILTNLLWKLEVEFMYFEVSFLFVECIGGTFLS